MFCHSLRLVFSYSNYNKINLSFSFKLFVILIVVKKNGLHDTAVTDSSNNTAWNNTVTTQVLVQKHREEICQEKNLIVYHYSLYKTSEITIFNLNIERKTACLGISKFKNKTPVKWVMVLVLDGSRKTMRTCGVK